MRKAREAVLSVKLEREVYGGGFIHPKPKHFPRRIEEDVMAVQTALNRRLGFREYKRREVNHSSWSGFSAYVSMELTQP